MTAIAPALENLSLDITEEIRVRSSLSASFAALLEEMGPSNEGHNGTPMPMTLEPWPGGRWFRELGDNNGHLWGHVQAIKRPTLLEITGPLMMSFAVASNLQYRLKNRRRNVDQRHHTALGLFPDVIGRVVAGLATSVRAPSATGEKLTSAELSSRRRRGRTSRHVAIISRCHARWRQSASQRVSARRAVVPRRCPAFLAPTCPIRSKTVSRSRSPAQRPEVPHRPGCGEGLVLPPCSRSEQALKEKAVYELELVATAGVSQNVGALLDPPDRSIWRRLKAPPTKGPGEGLSGGDGRAAILLRDRPQ